MMLVKQKGDVAFAKSDIDGKEYLVQNKEDKTVAANILAKLTRTFTSFISRLADEYPNDPRVKRLLTRFNADNISEGEYDSRYTTYTLNKGEKMVFCLRKRDGTDELHKENLLIFVGIHELAHIATVSKHHTDEFKTNFKFLVENAVKYGLYNPTNFRDKPVQYCGIRVTDTPLGNEQLQKYNISGKI